MDLSAAKTADLVDAVVEEVFVDRKPRRDDPPQRFAMVDFGDTLRHPKFENESVTLGEAVDELCRRCSHVPPSRAILRGDLRPCPPPVTPAPPNKPSEKGGGSPSNRGKVAS